VVHFLCCVGCTTNRYYPVRESLGAALLLSHNAPGAEAVFREGLRRSPNNGRMLFGLHEALVQERSGDAAAWVQKEFNRRGRARTSSCASVICKWGAKWPL